MDEHVAMEDSIRRMKTQPHVKRKRTLERIRWYTDHDAIARAEPGITHSFIGCFATALDCAGYVVDPIWLMGVTGFAFRIWVSRRLSPAAMNTFRWQDLLPQAAHCAGFNCTYIHADTSHMKPDDVCLLRAHEGIRHSIDRGIPAIAWDVNDPPMWGLIYGYNDYSRTYETLASWDYRIPLSYSSLGRRDVKVLSVLLLGDEREQDVGKVVRTSLRTALHHAEGHEIPPGATSRNGLAAFDLWANLMEPNALPTSSLQFVDYYAEMFFSFRCYARDYLVRVSDGDPRLEQAAAAYGLVADALRHVYEAVDEHRQDPPALGARLAEQIREARAHEETALQAIREYLEHPEYG